MQGLIDVWEVGGCVRDKLLNEIHGTNFRIKDVDFAVQGSFPEMRDWLLSEGFKIHTETPQYLTIRAGVPKGHPIREVRGIKDADFAVTRTEGSYTDGRHPDQVAPGTIEEDLSRRDFTPNAIAINAQTGEMLDLHDGMRDITERHLRTVGSTVDRFTEDALRGLRAVRFAITKGFSLSPGIIGFMKTEMFAELLGSVSNERKDDELMKCFRMDTVETIQMLNAFGSSFLTAIFNGPRGDMWLRPTLEKR